MTEQPDPKILTDLYGSPVGSMQHAIEATLKFLHSRREQLDIVIALVEMEKEMKNPKEQFSADLQEIMKINNRLREVLLEVRQFINDAPLGDDAHGILATIDATVR